MKELLILTTFLSSLIISSVANAGWTKVSKDAEGNIWYVGLERIKKHDGKIYFWYLTDWLKPNEYGDLSFKMYAEAECERFRFRILSATAYKAPMGEGQVGTIFKGIPQKNWTRPSTDSMHIGSVLKKVCN
jgi:hypothetical protein